MRSFNEEQNNNLKEDSYNEPYNSSHSRPSYNDDRSKFISHCIKLREKTQNTDDTVDEQLDNK